MVCFRVLLIAALTAGVASLEEVGAEDIVQRGHGNTHGLGDCIALKTANNKFATAESLLTGGKVKADKDKKQLWETFAVYENGNGVSLKSHGGTNTGFFVSADHGQLNAWRAWAKEWETFTVIWNDDGSVSFKTWNNRYIRSGDWWLDAQGNGYSKGEVQP